LLSSKNGLPLHPLSSRAGVRRDKRKGSEKFLKKLFKKFWWFEELIYLCTRFPQEQEFGGISEKVLKNF